MMKNTGVIFDMDGVLVDTLDALYQSYLMILARYGICGSKKEFNELNGPSMKEVVSILCGRYTSLPSPERLMKEFEISQQSLYEKAELVPLAKKLVLGLKNLGVSLALASSSSRKNIQVLLHRFDLTGCFDFVIGGDEVVCAKPHPEIYQKAALALNKPLLYAIDDSPLGVASALSAGVGAIQFTRDCPPLNAHAAYHVDSLDSIFELIKKPCQILSKNKAFSLQICDFDLSRYQREIDVCWGMYKTDSMFDGEVVLCLGFKGESIQVVKSKYRTVFYLLKNPGSELAKTLYPIGVSGFILDENKNTLIAKRSGAVSQHPGMYECPPSGGIENIDDEFGYKEQLLVELEEEVGVSRGQVANLIPLALLKDKQANQLDLMCVIKLNCDIKYHITENLEYTHFQSLPLSQLNAFLEEHDGLPECELITELGGEVL